MKNFLLSALILVSLTLSSFAQVSSSVTRFKEGFADGCYKLELTYKADSTGTLVSESFAPPHYDLSYNSTPITYRMKNVATYGIPKVSVYLQGVFQSSTDTLSLDTLITAKTNQGEDDTTGELTLNRKFAPTYQIYIKNVGGDITAGNLTLIFPIKK